MHAHCAGAVPQAPWVDKYRPRTFLDLLSEEQTNRSVVRWLRSWDASVFGRSGKGADARPEHRILLMSGPPGDASSWLLTALSPRFPV